MKLVKRLLVLVAAMTMVLSLVACGGDKWPKTYEAEQPRGVGYQKMTLDLNEDGTYKWSFEATDSKDVNTIVMQCTMEGKYTLDGTTVTLDTADGSGYYSVGAEKTEFEVSKDNPGMYNATDSQGKFVFELGEDGSFGPVTD